MNSSCTVLELLAILEVPPFLFTPRAVAAFGPWRRNLADLMPLGTLTGGDAS